ncbi:chaplin family protein [Streptomyces sp. NPDC046203]|uniref:chaplin n=1 Tax=Streptomyces sp. NPDC046203 TaxID=3154602 RepID=UPI00340E7910
MRQVTRITRISRKSLVTVAAAGGVLALGGGYAQADAGAHGVAAGSPGVASGNTVQVPVNVPVNICGDTVNVVGLMNPAMGTKCVNAGGGHGGHGGHGATATGVASNSPGVISGNNVQVPVDVPVNACGLSVDVIGLGNAAGGDACANGVEPTTPVVPTTPVTPAHPGTPTHPGHPVTPATPSTPHHPNTPSTHTVTPPMQELAQTGAAPLGLVLPVGAGMLLAGAVLYRKTRRAS